MIATQRQPKVPDYECVQMKKNNQAMERQKNNFDNRRDVMELSKVTRGDSIWMTDRELQARLLKEQLSNLFWKLKEYIRETGTHAKQ